MKVGATSRALAREHYERFRDYFEPSGFVEKVAARAIRPVDPITVSEWADSYRILQSVDTDEAGPWRTSRTPYLRAIMDSLTIAEPHRVVVFMKGAQIGATQCGNNFVGYVIHHAPGPMLIAQPTAEMAKRNSRQRIEPMIASCPALTDRIFGERALTSQGRAGQTVLQKMFEGGTLVMTGANSAAGLRSMSARYLFLDEVDGWPVDVDGEGDPVALAIARSRNFQRAKIYICSTPTVEGTSRIAAAFRRGDQRFYFVPCPKCGHAQVLKFGGPDCNYGLKLKSDRTGDVAYLCEKCGRTFEEHHKPKFLAEGQWKATAEGRPDIISFHLSSLYSPYGWYSWNQASDDFLEAKEFPLKLKGFVNTVLGETWRDEVSRLDEAAAAKHREKYPEKDGKLLVPKGVVMMTGGVDVQDDRLEFTTMGWGLAEECWVLEHDVVAGDPAKREVWDELWRRMFSLRPLERGGADYVRAWCIDTAGHHTNAAYEFCRPRYRVPTPDGRRILVFPTVCRAGPGHLWPRAPSRQNKAKILLWPLKVDAGKEALYSRLAKIAVPGPGYVHFPKHFGDPYFLQVAAEEIVHGFDLRGFPTRTWQLRSPGRRNEALDCWVLGYAALCGVIQHGFDLAKEARDLAMAAASISTSPGPSGWSRPEDRHANQAPGLENPSSPEIALDIEVTEDDNAGDGATGVEAAGSMPELGVEHLTEPNTSPIGPKLRVGPVRRRSGSRFISSDTGGWRGKGW